jgi:serine/threonine protein kinase
MSSTELFNDLDIDDRVVDRPDGAAVYRARQRSADRAVAVHVVGDAPRAPGEALQRLHALTRLKDPHVIEILGVATRDGKTLCVTEWAEGETLEAQLRKGYRFTTEEILHIAEGVGLALRAAGRIGAVHGHLRPSSILLTPDATVKIEAFGLRGGGEPAPPAARHIVYLAPEQAVGAQTDVRSDLYSLGAVLYELAAGRPPFEGYDSTTSLLFQVTHVDPTSPRQLGATIPRELERLILHCLSKSPADRPATPAEFLRELRQVRESMGTSRQSPVPQESDTGDFDIYEDQIVGEGGMGTLFRGRQRSLDRGVAIKVMREAFAANTELSQRFRREAELLAQVDCPNVIQVYGTGTWKGRLFFAMELVRGEDLSTRQKRGHRFSTAEILHIAEGVANALKAAWRYQIVHRDIKPSNILLTTDGAVKVADFGLAKSLRIPGESKVIAGTAEYISPEQGLGQRVDIRSDIYSLGVVLYELAASQHPFRGAASSIAMIFQHVHTQPPALEGLRISLPSDLQAIIHTCLRKAPEERFQKPDDLLRAIQAVKTRLHLKPPPGTQPLTAARGGWTRRAIVAAAALAAAAALTAGALRLAFPREVRERQRAFQENFRFLMGRDEAALRAAEAHGGRSCAEYREALERVTARRRREAEAEAVQAFEARRWTDAAARFERLRDEGPVDRRDEFDAVARGCRALAAAQAHEERKEWAAALELYRRQAGVWPADPHLQERILDLERRVAPPAPR